MILIIFIISVGCASSEIDGADSGFSDSGKEPNNLNSLNNSPNNQNNLNNATDAGTDGFQSDDSFDTGPDIPPIVCEDAQPGWNAIGSPISAFPGDTSSSQPSVVVDEQCRPVVAFHEPNSTDSPNVHIFRFENGVWNEIVAGGLDATGAADKWTTGVNIRAAHGTIWAAWSELQLDNTVGVFAARFNGTTWDVFPPAPIDGPVFSFALGFAIDSQERALVSWNERPDGLQRNMVRTARYDAGQWTSLGPAIADGTNNASALAPSLAIDSNDTPIVAWQESNAIHVRTWDGTTWVSTLPTPLAATYAFDANVASSVGGEISIGWRDANVSTNVFVSRLQNGIWSPIAADVNVEADDPTRTNTNNLTITIDSAGRTLFAFDEPRDGTSRIHVFREGTSLGSLDAHPGDTSGYWPSIVTDLYDQPIVAWQETDAATEIHVWRYGE